MTIEEAKKRLVAVAKAEVGYHEGGNNYTKYAEDQRISQLYGWNVQNQPWCCTFVNWCFLQAFGEIGAKMTYGGSAACAAQADLYRKNRAFYTSRPEIGDQIFFYSNGGINHTGIVVEVNGAGIRTVEGNYSDKVSCCTYTIGNSVIAGYGRPNWDLVLEDHEKPWLIVQDGHVIDNSEKTEKEGKEADGKPVTAQKGENHDWTPPLLKYEPDNYYAAAAVLQGLLNCHNFDSGKIDGYFGPKTETAVNKARSFYGMDATGTCDAELWKALGLT